MFDAKKVRAVLLSLVVVLTMVACSSDDDGGDASGDDTSTEETSDAAATVTIEDRTFSPSSLTVKSGDVIEVKNNDDVRHTFTSDDAGFDTSVSGGDTGTARVTTTTPGTYDFHCSIHTQMKGTVTVGA